MNKFIETNRTHWAELAKIHERPSDYYDIEGFKAGGLSLRPLERREVGEVRGKSLLHLQCHFGLDTLSWARLGAKVTGVDFSAEAIARARDLATECRLDARFICADVDEIGDLGETYDIVFTSFGTTVWLPNLDHWASLIARSIAPGGFFYIADGHPFSRCISNADDPSVLRIVEPYFQSGPTKYDGGTDYAVHEAPVSSPGYEWSHTLGEIVTALATAGLRIVFLHEFPYGDWEFLQNMRRGEDGYYR
ncbi:MAG: Methyltransferase type 11, partial [Myxococcales bacterium]|nr:Methyltransferase type 11 [Myxococcales bacterium]